MNGSSETRIRTSHHPATESLSEASRVTLSKKAAIALRDQAPAVRMVSRGVLPVKGMGQLECFMLDHSDEALQICLSLPLEEVALEQVSVLVDNDALAMSPPSGEGSEPGQGEEEQPGVGGRRSGKKSGPRMSLPGLFTSLSGKRRGGGGGSSSAAGS